MKNRTRALVALATAATVALGPTTVAHAARHAHTDASADVVRVDPETDAQSPAPNANQGDIRRFVANHRTHSVLVTVRFNDLIRRKQSHVHSLQLRTPTMRRDLTIVVTPDTGWQGQVFFSDRAERERPCANLATRIEWGTNVLQVKIPRRCLGGPEWVRAGYGYFRMTPKGLLFADEAHRNGSVGDTGPRFGPRTHQG